MKILFLSDIHGQYANLDKIDKIVEKQNIDLIVILGDICSYGLRKVDDALCQFLLTHQDHLICMRGNCDTDNIVRKTGLPMEEGLKKLTIDGIDMYLHHGHYYSYEKRYQFVDKEGVLIYGHYHIPYIKREEKMIYICVGSISYPRAQTPCSYLLYENKQFFLYSIDGSLLDYIGF